MPVIESLEFAILDLRSRPDTAQSLMHLRSARARLLRQCYQAYIAHTLSYDALDRYDALANTEGDKLFTKVAEEFAVKKKSSKSGRAPLQYKSARQRGPPYAKPYYKQPYHQAAAFMPSAGPQTIVLPAPTPEFQFIQQPARQYVQQQPSATYTSQSYKEEVCRYCRKPGHFARNCPHNKAITIDKAQ